MAGDEAQFGDVADHRHVAFLALVRVMRLAFIGGDLRRVDVERVVLAVVLPQQAAKHAAIAALQARLTFASLRPRICPTHPPHPIARGVTARNVVELKKVAKPQVAAQYPQIFQTSPAAREHQNQRQDVSRRGVPRRAAGTRQFMADQGANAHSAQIFAEQRQPALRRQCFFSRRQFEWQNRLQGPHRTLKVSDLTN